MWRVRFQYNDNPEKSLLTKTGVHNPEAAAFYAETILASPDLYFLVDEETGQSVPATSADPEADYMIESYWGNGTTTLSEQK